MELYEVVIFKVEQKNLHDGKKNLFISASHVFLKAFIFLEWRAVSRGEQYEKKWWAARHLEVGNCLSLPHHKG